MKALSALAGWKGHLLTAVLSAGVSAWIVSLMWGASEAKMARSHSVQVEQWATAANEAIQSVRNEEQRRLSAVEQQRVESIKLTNAYRVDNNRLRDVAAGWLRDVDALRRYALSRDPTLADGSPSGASAIGVLTYMLSRAIDRAELLAGVADRARIAGLTCERAYDAIRSTGSTSPGNTAGR